MAWRRANPKVIAAVLAALVLPVAGSALAALDMVVEGHTVYTVITSIDEERGFNVAILVREGLQFPNVLWFNDQWKTFFGGSERTPCGGYVVAVSTSDSDMYERYLGESSRQYRPWTASYRRTYHITDPNGFVSDTHLYSIRFEPGGSVNALITSVHNSWIDDDGESWCDPIVDAALADDPGSHGKPYHDGGNGVPVRKYNADLFGRWGDIGTGAGSKRHGETGADNGDVTGCEIDTEYECPTKGDDAEGNSHPYNPYDADAGHAHSHSAARIDLWFYSDNPDPRNIPPKRPNYFIYDTEMIESESSACRIDNGYHWHC